MYLSFAASLKHDSLNRRLIEWVNSHLNDKSMHVTERLFADYSVPLYNGDLEANSGLPEGAKRFVEELHAAHALIIAAPEYNYSISGPLKNLIDWASRAKVNPFAKKPLLLLSASPSVVGGHRGLWQTRIPLEGLGAFVYPDMFCLSGAHAAFDDNYQFNERSLQLRLETLLADFHHYTVQLTKTS